MRTDPINAATTGSPAVLDPDADLITTINTYTVAPERAEEVLSYLVDAAGKTMSDVPGFLSFNYHLSFDRTLIVNYGQWASREAIMAARDNPRVVALMAETEKVAGRSSSKPYVLRNSVRAAGQ